MYYSGIDLHKSNAVITAQTTDGQFAEQTTLPCSVPALQRYFAQHLGRHRIAIEAAGAWYWVRDAPRTVNAISAAPNVAPAKNCRSPYQSTWIIDELCSKTHCPRRRTSRHILLWRRQ